MGGDLDTRMFEFLGRYRITPHTTTGESPAHMLMSKTPRVRLDFLLPVRENRVIQQQEKAQETYMSTLLHSYGDYVILASLKTSVPETKISVI